MHLTQLFWQSQPTLVRLYILFLSYVLCITTVRWIQLSWRLYSRATPRRFLTPKEMLKSNLTPRAVAKSALAGVAVVQADTGSLDSSFDASESRRALVDVDTEFRQMWNRCRNYVSGAKRIIIFILLLGFFVAFHETIPTYRRTFDNSNQLGSSAAVETIDQTLWRLSLAFLMAAFIQLGIMIFEPILNDRKSLWESSCAKLWTK